MSENLSERCCKVVALLLVTVGLPVALAAAVGTLFPPAAVVAAHAGGLLAAALTLAGLYELVQGS